jgi:hypothetical protein
MAGEAMAALTGSFGASSRRIDKNAVCNLNVF